MSIESIARNIIASGGGNVLDDYYRFYNDGRWTVEVVRKTIATLTQMNTMESYSAHLPKLEECVGYVADIRLDELGVDSFGKEMEKHLKSIKKSYDEWEKADDDGKAVKYDEFMDNVTTARDYAVAFEKSCVNAFRNRYIDDEQNVRNLLGVIQDAGNKIMNGNASANQKLN